MGAVFSCAGEAAGTTENHEEQRRPVAPEAAVDWSAGLPEDILLVVMAALDVPGLVRSGAVCASWRDACATFRRLRLPSPRQGPCLLYACDGYGPSGDAALYCPSTGDTFRVPAFPGLVPHNKRGLVVSSGGWVFATDEVGDPYLRNPVTGAQATLPPVKTLPGLQSFFDDGGKHVWAADASDVKNGFPSQFVLARDWAYHRVAISAAAGDSAAACTVLVVHMWDEMLAFARPGDERWMSLSGGEPLAVGRHCRHFRNVLYNDRDGLFYALRFDGSIYTLDLNGPSPVVKKIMRDVTAFDSGAKYLAVAPCGDLLQVWRIRNHANGPVEERFTYQDAVAMNLVLQDHVDSTTDDDDAGGDKVSEQEMDGLRRDVEPRNRELMEKRGGMDTTELVIFKVDIGRQKLVKLRGIGDNALFIGDNAAVCLPAKDFPAFKPNCAYLTDDCRLYSPMLRADLGIWSLEKRSLQKLGDAWPNLRPRLDLVAPIWITPSLY